MEAPPHTQIHPSSRLIGSDKADPPIKLRGIGHPGYIVSHQTENRPSNLACGNIDILPFNPEDISTYDLTKPLWKLLLSGLTWELARQRAIHHNGIQMAIKFPTGFIVDILDTVIADFGTILAEKFNDTWWQH